MEKHIQILGILYIISGILTLMACGVAFLLVGGSGLVSGDETAILATGAVSLVIGMVGLILGLPDIIAGWGLLQRKSWSRILTIILGVLNLFAFPIGTALGIYSLWVLFKPEAESLLRI
ncbi:MAG: hypothetical protein GY841_06255 [FCB group bacterium]|nr:hypothetical protein [FCB group bacterium]